MYILFKDHTTWTQKKLQTVNAMHPIAQNVLRTMNIVIPAGLYAIIPRFPFIIPSQLGEILI